MNLQHNYFKIRVIKNTYYIGNTEQNYEVPHYEMFPTLLLITVFQVHIFSTAPQHFALKTSSSILKVRGLATVRRCYAKEGGDSYAKL
jgi:hypothetical protein